MLVKIHESYRKIIAVCDCELLGKRFEEGNMQIEITEAFYGGDEKEEVEVVELLQDLYKEDATFNIVGQKSVNTAIKAGIISKEGVIKIEGIPHALSLL